MTPIEKAARAMFDARPHRHPSGLTPDWDAQPEDIKNVFRADARAAVEALREPTPEMVAAARRFAEGDVVALYRSTPDTYRGFWSAMLVAALNEGAGDGD